MIGIIVPIVAFVIFIIAVLLIYIYVIKPRNKIFKDIEKHMNYNGALDIMKKFQRGGYESIEEFEESIEKITKKQEKKCSYCGTVLKNNETKCPTCGAIQKNNKN